MGTAFSYRGVNCYLDTFQILGGQAETACPVHAIHGNIEYEGRQYDSVVDLQGKRQFDYGGLQVKKETIQLATSSTTVPNEPLRLFGSGPWITETTVSETEHEAGLKNTLQCSYNISTPKAILRLHTGDLMLHILCRSGEIAYSRGPHCSDKLALPCSIGESGLGCWSQIWRELDLQRPHCVLYLAASR